jgi:septal ring factor EnvC (AmiA/AmiB activator)
LLAEKKLSALEQIKISHSELEQIKIKMKEEVLKNNSYVLELKDKSQLLAANLTLEKELLSRPIPKEMPVIQAKKIQSVHVKKRQIETAYLAQKSMTGPVAGEGFRALLGRLSYPIEATIENSFGRIKDSETGLFVFHKGLSFRSAPGQTTTSVADGTVVYAGPLKNYGSVVILEHSGGYYTLYGNLNSVAVQKGDLVKTEQGLGLTSDVPLYFEIRNRNVAVDPSPWFLGRNAKTLKSLSLVRKE